VKALLVIAAVAAIAAVPAGCGSGSGGHDIRVAIHAVVRAGCSARPATGRPYPGSIVVVGAGSRRVVRIGGREVARVAVDPGGYRAGAAWVAGSRLVSARVDGRAVAVTPSGLVRFRAPTGVDTDLRLVVGLRRTDCTPPGAAG
jgi:predicted small secreted protein